MFDKDKFAKIILDISELYDNQRDFSLKSKISRTFLSEYINKKIDKPPKPATLEKLVQASHGKTTYNELMLICGYTDYIIDDFFEGSITNEKNKIPIIDTIKYESDKKRYVTIPTQRYAYTNIDIKDTKEYIAVISQDDSMIPLIGNGDIVIIEKTSIINNGRVHLLCVDDKIVLRRVLKKENNTYDIEPLNMRYPKETLKEIHSIGEVVSVEIKSAFNN